MRYSCTNNLVLAVFFFGLSALCSAQEAQVLSPYSAYGLGDLAPGMFAQQRATAGVSLGVSDPYRLLPGLVSSYANLKKPVFAVSMRSQFVTETSATETFKRSNAQFMGLGFGLPINKGSWGVGFGLIPQTSVGYELSDNITLANGDPVEFNYSGSGGLNKMYVGVSKRVFTHRDSLGHKAGKVLVGGQMNYTFGSIATTRRTIFPRDQGYFNTNSTANVIIRAPDFNFSAQYHYSFRTQKRKDDKLVKHDWTLTTGLFYDVQKSLGARRTDLTTSYFLTTLGVEVTQDTIDFIDRAKGTITPPSSFGFGIGATRDDKLSFALEYRVQDWNELKVNVEGWDLPAELGTRRSLAAGFSYNPKGFQAIRGDKDFWAHTTYSLGFRTESDYLIINGTQLESYALSAGLSLPFDAIRGKSRLTIGTELGSRGNTENGAIRERYVEIFVGFSVTPSLFESDWFKKRRIE